jgi:hypothetical protein
MKYIDFIVFIGFEINVLWSADAFRCPQALT